MTNETTLAGEQAVSYGYIEHNESTEPRPFGPCPPFAAPPVNGAEPSFSLGFLPRLLDRTDVFESAADETSFKLFEIVHEVVETVRVGLPDRNVFLTYRIEMPLESVFLGPVLLIQRVLADMLVRAIRLTPKGEIHLFVRPLLVCGDSCGRREHREILFSVTDHDRENSCPLVFFRRKLELPDDPELLQVEKNVQRLRGRTYVRYEPGSGTTVYVTVPLAPDPSASCPQTDNRFAAPFARFKGNPVLLAEDNEAYRILIRQYLKRIGLKPTVVNNGSEAVAALRHCRFDLVLMDALMPEMDGFNATRLIRTLSKSAAGSLPILGMVNHMHKDDAERCLESGMDDCLFKPIDPTLLRQAMDRWIVRGEGGSAVQA